MRNNSINPTILVLMLVAVASTILVSFDINIEITRSKAAVASELMGIDFSDQELDSLLPAINNYRDDYIKNREAGLNNEVPFSLIFSPLPQNFEMPDDYNEAHFSFQEPIKLPANLDELAFMSISELSYLIKSKQISSTRLTSFFIERLKKHNSTLHCAITITEELAMKQAKQADEEMANGIDKGLLHGIPYGAKDLFAVKGYKTTWGATPYKDQVIEDNATVVEKLEEKGAVLIAKLTLGALAWGDVWYGEKTRNPWDTSRGSSGSSAGSASAVAAGLMPFALGTETLGSIVSPSTVCGTTGLRPTFGRVSRSGAMALSWSMDKIGPICRSVEDCAIVFDAIRGSDGEDLSVIDAPFNYDHEMDAKQLKIGYLKSSFEGNYPFKENDSLALLKLEKMGFELIPIELPPMPNLSFILTVEAAAAFDDLTLSGKDDLMVRQVKNAWPNVFRQSRFVPAVEYIQANRLRSKLIEDMEKVMQEVDVYIHPSWASPSLRITNYTGHPCVVLPNGFREGRPTSISFTGRLFQESEVLAVAKAFQDATEHHLKHPEL